ncbi:MAG: hypothetical protein ABH879_02085 [archaeon]
MALVGIIKQCSGGGSDNLIPADIHSDMSLASPSMWLGFIEEDGHAVVEFRGESTRRVEATLPDQWQDFFDTRHFYNLDPDISPLGELLPAVVDETAGLALIFDSDRHLEPGASDVVGFDGNGPVYRFETFRPQQRAYTYAEASEALCRIDPAYTVPHLRGQKLQTTGTARKPVIPADELIALVRKPIWDRSDTTEYSPHELARRAGVAIDEVLRHTTERVRGLQAVRIFSQLTDSVKPGYLSVGDSIYSLDPSTLRPDSFRIRVAAGLLGGVSDRMDYTWIYNLRQQGKAAIPDGPHENRMSSAELVRLSRRPFHDIEYTPEELMARYGVGRGRFAQLIESGDIPASMTGRLLTSSYDRMRPPIENPDQTTPYGVARSQVQEAIGLPLDEALFAQRVQKLVWAPEAIATEQMPHIMSYFHDLVDDTTEFGPFMERTREKIHPQLEDKIVIGTAREMGYLVEGIGALRLQDGFQPELFAEIDKKITAALAPYMTESNVKAHLQELCLPDGVIDKVRPESVFGIPVYTKPTVDAAQLSFAEVNTAMQASVGFQWTEYAALVTACGHFGLAGSGNSFKVNIGTLEQLIPMVSTVMEATAGIDDVMREMRSRIHPDLEAGIVIETARDTDILDIRLGAQRILKSGTDQLVADVSQAVEKALQDYKTCSEVEELLVSLGLSGDYRSRIDATSVHGIPVYDGNTPLALRITLQEASEAIYTKTRHRWADYDSMEARLRELHFDVDGHGAKGVITISALEAFIKHSDPQQARTDYKKMGSVTMAGTEGKDYFLVEQEEQHPDAAYIRAHPRKGLIHGSDLGRYNSARHALPIEQVNRVLEDGLGVDLAGLAEYGFDPEDEGMHEYMFHGNRVISRKVVQAAFESQADNLVTAAEVRQIATQRTGTFELAKWGIQRRDLFKTDILGEPMYRETQISKLYPVKTT